MDAVTDAAAAAGPWVLLVGTLVGAIRAVFVGALVPRPQVDELKEQWEARLADLEQRLTESHQREQDWRTAYERTDERADVTGAQVAELLTIARTTDAVLQALPLAAPASGAAPTIPRGFPRPPGGRENG